MQKKTNSQWKPRKYQTEPYRYEPLTHDRDGTDIIFQEVLTWKNHVPVLYPQP